MRLEGRTALVTGGARGIGEAHVRALAAEGARVAVCDLLEEDGRALAAAVGDAARYVALDVREEASWQAAVAETEAELGPISILVNNAGVLAVQPIAEMPVEEWRRVLDTNVTGAFLGTKAVAPSMRRAGGGCIVNISSMAAFIAVAPASAYTTSKWALRGFTKAAALELAPHIRVNSVHPGMIDTPMIAGASDEETQAAKYPIPRFGRWTSDRRARQPGATIAVRIRRSRDVRRALPTSSSP